MHLFDLHRISQSRLAISFFSLVVCVAFALGLDHATMRAETNEATAVNGAFGFEYAVPNGPRNLVAEAPGRIWYTATDAGGIGFLEVISDTAEPVVRYRTDFYGLGHNSQPYDLVYDDGVVWFTLRGVRSLGKIDVTTREIELFPLLTPGAAPTGIDVDPSGQVWLAQSNGRISRFDPASEEFVEFLMPVEIVGKPYVEDLAYANERNIWFTMPDANLVVAYNSVTGRFHATPTGYTSPLNIHVDNGAPWVTANGSGRIGRYTITTVSTWIWYDTPTPDSGPAGVLVFDDEQGVTQVWLTQNGTGNAGRIELYHGFQVANRENLQLSTTPGSPWGIILAPDEHIWIADTSRNVLYELTQPYIDRLHLTWIP